MTDGYDMSLGELINLYRDDELVIDPAFQRLFRWDDERKTRFVESLLLGIPIPSIFVYQNDDGVWELIDGLQRVSTILQLTGDLKGKRADEMGPLTLGSTRFLPSLSGKTWKASKDSPENGLGKTLQLDIKRARIRVEILKSDSDSSAKYELFQRLNTGGVRLSDQEVRNSIAISLRPKFHKWLVGLSKNTAFVQATRQTSKALEAQAGVELVLRFLAFVNVKYARGMDVNEYLNDALIKLATDDTFDLKQQGDRFLRVFTILFDALGASTFQRWRGSEFKGKFLMSNFEVMTMGVAKNLKQLEAMDDADRSAFLVGKAKNLSKEKIYNTYSGAGISGPQRLTNLLPFAESYLKP